jgi:transposase-like protein
LSAPAVWCLASGRSIARVAKDLGVPADTLRVYVRQMEANEGRRKDMLTVEERWQDPQAASLERGAASRE